jgi:hypothetical protein
MKFSSFLDKKKKQTVNELKIIKDVLSQGDLKVEDFTEEEAPYLFVNSTEESLDFDGVRVYKVGSNMAYRIQREKKTEPYGTAYPLNLENMFGDLISDMSEEKAAEDIKKAVIEEFKIFFKRSSEAQDEINSGIIDDSGRKLVSSGFGDISNSMSN